MIVEVLGLRLVWWWFPLVVRYRKVVSRCLELRLFVICYHSNSLSGFHIWYGMDFMSSWELGNVYSILLWQYFFPTFCAWFGCLRYMLSFPRGYILCMVWLPTIYVWLPTRLCILFAYILCMIWCCPVRGWHSYFLSFNHDILCIYLCVKNVVGVMGHYLRGYMRLPSGLCIRLGHMHTLCMWWLSQLDMMAYGDKYDGLWGYIWCLSGLNIMAYWIDVIAYGSRDDDMRC